MVPRDSDSRSRDFMDAKSRQHDVQPKVNEASTVDLLMYSVSTQV